MFRTGQSAQTDTIHLNDRNGTRRGGGENLNDLGPFLPRGDVEAQQLSGMVVNQPPEGVYAVDHRSGFSPRRIGILHRRLPQPPSAKRGYDRSPRFGTPVFIPPVGI
jgi:hypothetical protein